MKIKLTMVSTTGCTFTSDGEVSGVINPKFTGTVTITPGGKCTTSGTFVFGDDKKKDEKHRVLSVKLNSSDLAKVTKATWSGDAEAIKALNSAKLNRHICDVMRSVPIATISP